ncbi:MAG: hypothetical protein KIT09_05550 [Bryobacteraceae bacterium]|nr:hypothetical protein [Bryobacteraceae bacterium]
MIVLGLAAMDNLEEDLLAAMREALEDNFPGRVASPPPIGSPDAYDPSRRQHNAPLVLKRLLTLFPPGVDKIVAVTACDLFIPMLSFVYGQAQLDGRVAAVSVARLRPEFYGLAPHPPLLLTRARKEAVHETGHLFGLVHCMTNTCAMSLSTNIHQIDLKRDVLCPACRARVWERVR